MDCPRRLAPREENPSLKESPMLPVKEMEELAGEDPHSDLNAAQKEIQEKI